MILERCLPTERLRPFVKTFVLIDSEQGVVNRILPDTGLVLAFRCRGNVRYTDEMVTTPLPAAVITGLRHSFRLIYYAQETATFLVIFREGRAGAFFRESLHELFGISAALDDFVHRSLVNELEERLAGATNNRQRVLVIEQFLLSRLNETAEDKLVRAALQRIHLSRGTVRMKELLTDLPISQDPFEKRFRRVVRIRFFGKIWQSADLNARAAESKY